MSYTSKRDVETWLNHNPGKSIAGVQKFNDYGSVSKFGGGGGGGGGEEYNKLASSVPTGLYPAYLQLSPAPLFIGLRH